MVIQMKLKTFANCSVLMISNNYLHLDPFCSLFCGFEQQTMHKANLFFASHVSIGHWESSCIVDFNQIFTKNDALINSVDDRLLHNIIQNISHFFLSSRGFIVLVWETIINYLNKSTMRKSYRLNDCIGNLMVYLSKILNDSLHLNNLYHFNYFLHFSYFLHFNNFFVQKFA